MNALVAVGYYLIISCASAKRVKLHRNAEVESAFPVAAHMMLRNRQRPRPRPRPAYYGHSSYRPHSNGGYAPNRHGVHGDVDTSGVPNMPQQVGAMGPQPMLPDTSGVPYMPPQVGGVGTMPHGQQYNPPMGMPLPHGQQYNPTPGQMGNAMCYPKKDLVTSAMKVAGYQCQGVCSTPDECRAMSGRWKPKYCTGGPGCGCCKEIGFHGGQHQNGHGQMMPPYNGGSYAPSHGGHGDYSGVPNYPPQRGQVDYSGVPNMPPQVGGMP